MYMRVYTYTYDEVQLRDSYILIYTCIYTYMYICINIHIHDMVRLRYSYWVATISRLPKIIGLFCKRAL